jgi:Bacterial nucleoid DNA-binding protein
MNKTELIKAVAAAAKIPCRESAAAVGAALDAIASALAAGEKVTLSGFGTFETRRLPARAGRNPRTGEAVMIAARKAPAFKPCKGLKEKVNG